MPDFWFRKRKSGQISIHRRVALCVFLCPVTAEAAGAEPDRLLTVLAGSADDPGLLEQRRLLSADPAGLAGRDLAVRETIGGGGGLLVILIGRDGGEKRRWTRPVTTAELFAVIDAMPMGRVEAARRGKP